MEKRITMRQIAPAGPPRNASTGEKVAATSEAAAAASAAAAAAPQSDLWPLSPHFPVPALQLVRSKLPARTLGALRLVNRAARDDFVDALATRVRPRWRDDDAVEALVCAAPRLRSLVSLKLRCSLDVKECATLGDALERLPAGGAALRELHLKLSGTRRLPAAPWRAPWLSRLTRLSISVYADQMQPVIERFAPGTLPALRTLEFEADQVFTGGRTLRRLLAACDAAALETLVLQSVAGAALRDAAASLPALRALELRSFVDFCFPEFYDEWLDGGEPEWPPGVVPAGLDTYSIADEAWSAFLAAPLAPLSRLVLEVGRYVVHDLPALFARGWASSLCELKLNSVFNDDEEDSFFDPDMPNENLSLRSLSCLSALTALSKLAVKDLYLDEDMPLTAAGDRWATRLVDFELTWECRRPGMPSDDTLVALLGLPLRRLERLGIRRRGAKLAATTAAALSAACAVQLPQLTMLDFFSS